MLFIPVPRAAALIGCLISRPERSRVLSGVLALWGPCPSTGSEPAASPLRCFATGSDFIRCHSHITRCHTRVTRHALTNTGHTLSHAGHTSHTDKHGSHTVTRGSRVTRCHVRVKCRLPPPLRSTPALSCTPPFPQPRHVRRRGRRPPRRAVRPRLRGHVGPRPVRGGGNPAGRRLRRGAGRRAASPRAVQAGGGGGARAGP